MNSASYQLKWLKKWVLSNENQVERCDSFIIENGHESHSGTSSSEDQRRGKLLEMITKSQAELDVDKLKKKLLPILKRYQVCRAGIFGSTAEGTARETSDVDLLIEFQGEKSLLDLVALKLDLETEINRNIDVLTYKALNPLIKKRVLAQEVRIL